MSNLPFYVFKVTGLNGDALPGAKLYTYQTASAVALATYSDEALTVANANPIVADSAGYFGPIYLQNAAYRLKLTTSAGVTIKQVDNVRGAVLDSSLLQTRITRLASTPMDFGAIGDGVADESSMVQDALDVTGGTFGSTVDLCGRVFRCDSAIQLVSGHTLKNGTLDFSNAAGDCINFDAAEPSVWSTLTGNVAIGATTIPVNYAGQYYVGQWVAITDNASAATAVSQGELVQITSIVGLNIGISRGLNAAYTVANAAKLRYFDNVSNCTLENLTIIGSNAGATNAVFARCVDNLVVRNCRFQDGLTGVKCKWAAKTRIEGCDFNLATGVQTLAAVHETSIAGCKAHSTATDLAVVGYPDTYGVTRDTLIKDCFCESANIHVDQGSARSRVEGCFLQAGAILAEGTDVHIVRNNLDSPALNYPIALAPDNCHLSAGYAGNFDVTDNVGGGISFAPTTTDVKRVEISRNRIEAALNRGIMILPDAAATNIRRVRIADNQIINAAVIPIDVNGAPLTNVLENIVVEGNVVTGTVAVATAIHVDYGAEIVVRDNHVSVGAAAGSIDIKPQSTLVISGNRSYSILVGEPTAFASATDTTITDNQVYHYISVQTVATGNYLLVANNNLSDAGGGILVGSVGRCDIIGNTVNSGTTTINVTLDVATQISSIIANRCYRANDTGANINVSTSGAQVQVDGNIIQNGTYGIEGGAAANTFTNNNTIYNVATAATHNTTDNANYVR